MPLLAHKSPFDCIDYFLKAAMQSTLKTNFLNVSPVVVVVVVLVVVVVVVVVVEVLVLAVLVLVVVGVVVGILYAK